MGPFDEAGNVRRHEAAVAVAHHPQVRRQRGEGVVRNLGPRRGDDRYQRGLACVGQPDEAHVGQQPQLQPKLPLLSGQARLGETRRLARSGGEAAVALAALAATGHDHVFRRSVDVGDDLAAVRVSNQGPHGHPDYPVCAVLPVLVLAAPVLAAVAAIEPLVAQVQQGGQVRVRRHPHVAAVAAVAAVRTSLGDELLAAKAHAATAAVAGLHRDLNLVDELHGAWVPGNPLLRSMRAHTDYDKTGKGMRDEECRGESASIGASHGACMRAKEFQAGRMATRLRDRPQR